MNLQESIAERHALSKQYLQMARKFGSGELKFGSVGQPEEDGLALQKRYKKMAIQARRSAMLLRRVAINTSAIR